MGVALLSSHLKGAATKNFQAPVRFYPGSAPDEGAVSEYEDCYGTFMKFVRNSDYSKSDNFKKLSALAQILPFS